MGDYQKDQYMHYKDPRKRINKEIGTDTHSKNNG